jgi:death on curing protein
MVQLKIRRFGNSLGVVLPKEVIQRLQTGDGERVFLIESGDGDYRLTPYDPAFEDKMDKAEQIMNRYRNTLHALAKWSVAKKKKEPLWIETRDALAIHDRNLALHGGTVGVRDHGLLDSALARPRQHYAYADSPNVIEMAVLYTAGIVRNHPFVDGNKRTGFVIGILFLELNGFDFKASEADATHSVMGLAAGTLDEAGYAIWLRENSSGRRGRGWV